MKALKYLHYIILITLFSTSASAQFGSFDPNYTMDQIISSENEGRSYIVLKYKDVIIDSLLETYNSIGRSWRGFESYYIASPEEVAFVNQGIYKLMRLHEDGIWRSDDFFQLMYCRKDVGVITPDYRQCCTKWRLEGLYEIYRSERDQCNQEPEWVKMDFYKVRQQVQHLRGGTPEQKMWIEKIKEEARQDSIKKSKN